MITKFPDSWIELYNNSPEIAHAENYRLSLFNNPESAWVLPDTIIPPYSYLVVYCDKESTGLHTDFKLETEKKSSIYLFKNSEIIDCILDLNKMPAPDISYGRMTDGVDKSGYQLQPSPGESNKKGVAVTSKPLPKPIFSVPGRVSNQEVFLDLTIPAGCPAGTVLRYTLDSSEVNENSLVYDGRPLEIKKTTIVRARLFHPHYLSGPSITNSYIFHHTDKEIPILSIVSDPYYFNDPEIGIYYGNNRFQDWRRPCNIEFFESFDSDAAINQLCETRVSGHSSRQYANAPFIVYAGKQFDEKRFKHELFPEDKPGITKFKSFTVRNGGDDYYQCNMRDAVIQRSSAPYIDADWQGARVISVYRNGNWIGIMNLRERGNKANIEANYDGLEDIDMIEKWEVLMEGDIEAFNKLQETINDPESVFQDFESQMDINQFVDSQMIYLYFNNCDYPSNNIILWKPKTSEGKWRQIMKDSDYGLGLIDKANDETSGTPYFKTINWLYDAEYPGVLWGHSEPYTRCFRRLMSFPEVTEPFIDRTFVALGSFLRSEKILNVIEGFEDDMRAEIELYRAKYNITKYGSFDENIDYMKNWIIERAEFFPYHFAEFYDLGELCMIELDGNISGITGITINDVPLQTDYFKGYFPKERVLKIEATLKDSEEYVIKWKIAYFEDTTDAISSEEENTTGNSLVLNKTAFNKVVVAPIIENSQVSEILDNTSKSVHYFDLNGIEHHADKLTPGLYLRKQGSSVTKIIIK